MAVVTKRSHTDLHPQDDKVSEEEVSDDDTNHKRVKTEGVATAEPKAEMTVDSTKTDLPLRPLVTPDSTGFLIEGNTSNNKNSLFWDSDSDEEEINTSPLLEETPDPSVPDSANSSHTNAGPSTVALEPAPKEETLDTTSSSSSSDEDTPEINELPSTGQQARVKEELSVSAKPEPSASSASVKPDPGVSSASASASAKAEFKRDESNTSNRKNSLFWDSDSDEEESNASPLREETPDPSVPDSASSPRASAEPSIVGLEPVPKEETMDTTTSSSSSSSSDEDAPEINQASSTGQARVKEEHSVSVKPIPSVSSASVKPDPGASSASVKPDPGVSSASVKAECKLDLTMSIDLADSSDEEDDFLEILEIRSPFAAKADLKREKELEKFESEEDKALQRLLWSLNFGDTLYPHQTMVVRRVAGLPERFPLHQHEKGIKLAPEQKHKMDISLAVLGLRRQPPTRGILLADEMGLGKTIESIAGMILYNGIEEHRTGKKRPSLIVTPNRAVLDQWIEALKRNGVRRNRIKTFTKGMAINHTGNDFILMEKSKLQIEIKAIFSAIIDKKSKPDSSSLFPHITREDYRKLCTQYRAAQGKEKNIFRRNGELPDDCVRRLVEGMVIRMQQQNKEASFRTVVIDECHFLKNQLAYWGIAGLLLSAHSERAIPMSGTPYNNSVNDLAAAMGYIDVTLKSSRNHFWVTALKSGSTREHVRDALKDWNEEYLVRRTKEETLKHLLRTKTIKREIVEQHPDEIFLQEHYEGIIVKILDTFSRSLAGARNAYAMQEQKRMYSILMACISSARMAAIHPMLPGGREFTKHFSPSRRHMISGETKKDVCVCCSQSLRPTIQIIRPDDEESKEKAKEKRKRVRQHRDLDLDDENLDDEEIDDLEREEEEELVPLPASICKLSSSDCPHFVHENCLEGMIEGGDSCPRCEDAARRLHFKRSDGLKAQVYCKGIEAIPGMPGFTLSSKLNQVVEHVRQNIPEEDKVLILSFFKGSLDLLEGIFEEELGIQTCRFDGDLGPTKANEDLARFKDNPEKRILLATVQSGGTGLNIVEANHVLFIDRHFNPFTHAQAMDRCYRLRQKKDVYVHFFDAAGSIDEVMNMLNHYKSQNSKVILADGTELGANSGGTLSYQEVSGLLSRALYGISSSRRHHILENGRGSMIPATSSELLDSILNNTLETDYKFMFEALMKAQWGTAAEKDPSTQPMPEALAEALLG